MNLFGQKANHDAVAASRVKEWVREALALGDDVVVTVAELRCAEEDCPDVETVVGILEQGNQRKFKVLKPLPEVTWDDLLVALLRSD
jgi:hypothetical protein